MLESPEKLNNHAVRLAAAGDYEDAIACLRRAITVGGKSHLLWYNLAQVYRDAGNLGKAREAMECACKMNPSNEEILENLAEICLDQGDLDRSLEVSLVGIENNNKNPHFWNLVGVAQGAKGNLSDAMASLERALFLFPAYTEALCNLGDVYAKVGNMPAARECRQRMKPLIEASRKVSL